jgi:hypothetical protein
MTVAMPGPTAKGVPTKLFWKPIMNRSFSSSKLPLNRSRSRSTLLTPVARPSPLLVYCQKSQTLSSRGPPKGMFHAP